MGFEKLEVLRLLLLALFWNSSLRGFEKSIPEWVLKTSKYFEVFEKAFRNS